MRERRPVPPSILNAPELRFGLEMYYGAFLDLLTCRAIGTALGPIPWTAINQYAKAYDYTDEQEDDLQFYVSRMDNAYLEHLRKKGPK